MTVIFLLRRKREAGEGAGLLEMVHSEQGDSRLSSSPVQGHLRNSGLTWGRSAPPPPGSKPVQEGPGRGSYGGLRELSWQQDERARWPAGTWLP